MKPSTVIAALLAGGALYLVARSFMEPSAEEKARMAGEVLQQGKGIAPSVLVTATLPYFLARAQQGPQQPQQGAPVNPDAPTPLIRVNAPPRAVYNPGPSAGPATDTAGWHNPTDDPGGVA